MKAPEKIYLHGYDFDKEPCVKWHEKPMEKGMRGYHVVNVEYIRKDALMEWLEGKMTIEGATEGIVGGYDLALKDVIKHIKSL